jgi:WD40 repeat protein
MKKIIVMAITLGWLCACSPLAVTPAPAALPTQPELPTSTQPAPQPDPVITAANLAEMEQVHTIKNGSNAAWSPDGKTLAVIRSGPEASSAPYLIDVYETTGLEKVRSIQTNCTGPIMSLKISPDGKMLAYLDGNGYLGVSDAATGQELKHFETGEFVPMSFTDLAFSPDGKVLAMNSGPSDYAILLRDLSSGQILYSLGAGVADMAFSPTGQMLADWNVSQGVELRQAGSGRLLLTLPGNAGYPLAFSPDGTRLAAATVSGDVNTVWVWDATTGQVLQSLGGINGFVEALVFSPDGSLLATAAGGKLLFYEAAAGRLAGSLEVSGPGELTLAFSPDGRRLATSRLDGDVAIWGVPLQ